MKKLNNQLTHPEKLAMHQELQKYPRAANAIKKVSPSDKEKAAVQTEEWQIAQNKAKQIHALYDKMGWKKPQYMQQPWFEVPAS